MDFFIEIFTFAVFLLNYRADSHLYRSVEIAVSKLIYYFAVVYFLIDTNAEMLNTCYITAYNLEIMLAGIFRYFGNF